MAGSVLTVNGKLFGSIKGLFTSCDCCGGSPPYPPPEPPDYPDDPNPDECTGNKIYIRWSAPVPLGNHAHPDYFAGGNATVSITGSAISKKSVNMKKGKWKSPLTLTWGPTGCQNTLVATDTDTVGHYIVTLDFWVVGDFSNRKTSTITITFNTNYRHGERKGGAFKWYGSTNVNPGTVEIGNGQNLYFSVKAPKTSKGGRFNKKTTSIELNGDSLLGFHENDTFKTTIKISAN